ncbi:DUF2510 domain-containing protein [Rhodococcus phenolicus]|uniref:DUF2510 domain-containing protein n=1 Tax=Rhodococcus phenolicus TaxID=263849 RepID=UPI0009EE5134
MPNAIQASWYTDPQNPAMVRYFDGSMWTSQTNLARRPRLVALQPPTGLTDRVRRIVEGRPREPRTRPVPTFNIYTIRGPHEAPIFGP